MDALAHGARPIAVLLSPCQLRRRTIRTLWVVAKAFCPAPRVGRNDGQMVKLAAVCMDRIGVMAESMSSQR